jgi:hypothetical protein
VTYNDKRSSLLRFGIGYGHKRFYITGTDLYCESRLDKKFVGRIGSSFIQQLRNSKKCVRAQSDFMLKKVLPYFDFIIISIEIMHHLFVFDGKKHSETRNL